MRNKFLLLIVSVIAVTAVAPLMLAGCGSSDQAAGQEAASKEATAKDLYREALANALSVDQKISGSFNVDSGATKFKGDFSGSPSGNDARVRGTMDISSDARGLPLSMSAELVGIGKGTKDKVDKYLRFTAVTTSRSAYKQKVQETFAPVLNKWVKMNDDSSPDEPSTLEKDGAGAALDLLDFYAPLVSLSDSDKDIFLSSVDRNNLYEVADGIEKTQYKGVEARKVRVSVNKDALLKVEDEVAAAISKESNFEASDPQFIDEVFGKRGKLTANVYLSPDSAKIIGVEIHLDLDKPIDETQFDTTLDKITTSILVNYDRELAIIPPDSFITEDEMNALMPS